MAGQRVRGRWPFRRRTDEHTSTATGWERPGPASDEPMDDAVDNPDPESTHPSVTAQDDGGFDHGNHGNHGDRAVNPDHPAKPDSPADLKKPSWIYVARKTVREFSDDQCTDLAAALTYYAVLAMFPAFIAILSLVSLVGQGSKTVDTLLGILRDVGATGAADTLEPTLTQLSQSQSSGLALVIGLAAALWSASGYVGAFGRGMNRIYEIDEGRPIWKLRPTMLLVTLITVVLTALVALSLVLTGPAAQAVGDAVGLGSTAVTIWNIAKWPVLLAVVVLIVAPLCQPLLRHRIR